MFLYFFLAILQARKVFFVQVEMISLSPHFDTTFGPQWFLKKSKDIAYLHISLLMTVNMLYQLCILERMGSSNDQQDEGQNSTIHLCKTLCVVRKDIKIAEISF